MLCTSPGLLQDLIGDANPMVVANAVAALSEIQVREAACLQVFGMWFVWQAIMQVSGLHKLSWLLFAHRRS